jgi:hypothetical protein
MVSSFVCLLPDREGLDHIGHIALRLMSPLLMDLGICLNMLMKSYFIFYESCVCFHGTILSYSNYSDLHLWTARLSFKDKLDLNSNPTSFSFCLVNILKPQSPHLCTLHP